MAACWEILEDVRAALTHVARMMGPAEGEGLRAQRRHALRAQELLERAHRELGDYLVDLEGWMASRGVARVAAEHRRTLRAGRRLEGRPGRSRGTR